MRFFVLVSFGILLFGSCADESYQEVDDYYLVYESDRDCTIEESLKKIASANIYFGHQSVGYNILEGIAQFEKETGVELNIIETGNFDQVSGPSFVHYQIGENKNAVSKVDDFADIMTEVGADSGNTSFFKFCYIDFKRYHNVDSVFPYYKENMLMLKEKYPGTKIILFTVPLRAVQKGPKAWVKKAISKPVGDVLDNINREKFNQLVRNELGSEFAIFDIAQVESVLPDGSVHTFKHEGREYPAMPYLYTKDQGHLNEYGARIVAHNLINFLAKEID